MPRQEDPQSRFGESLTRLLARYRDSVEHASKELSSEAVHDVRVASRRLMAGLDAARFLLRSKKAARLQRELKKGIRELGPLRDAHVQLKLAEAELTSGAMTEFVRNLEENKKRLKRAGSGELSRLEPRKFKKPIAEFGRRIERPLENVDPEYFLFTLNSIADLTFNSVVRSAQALELRRPKTFHRLRIKVRNFRYLLEFLQPLLSISDARIVRIKRYQDALGEIHDLMVFVDRIERFFPSREPASAAPVELLRRPKERLASKLHIFMGSAETVLDLWPALPVHVNSPVRREQFLDVAVI